jgi:hypothetical protein
MDLSCPRGPVRSPFVTEGETVVRHVSVVLWALLIFITIREGSDVLYFIVATYVIPAAERLQETWQLIQSLWK